MTYHGRVVVRPLALDGLGAAGGREAFVAVRDVSLVYGVGWALWRAYPGYFTPSISYDVTAPWAEACAARRAIAVTALVNIILKT